VKVEDVKLENIKEIKAADAADHKIQHQQNHSKKGAFDNFEDEDDESEYYDDEFEKEHELEDKKNQQ